MARGKAADPTRMTDIDVSEEMRVSFLEYAYSVIYARALPDARDGLKPVQRRILFQMGQMGLRPDRGHVKSARVVGEVMGRLHPHGDSAIYDALVRLAQPFSLRLPLVDGHGNFGTPDDGPAAMRYTEARLAPAALDMTASLDEGVVDFTLNYDGREREPIVLPAAFPNLLVNGASGIAVGMATSLVPHNVVEVIAGARHLLAHPHASLADIRRLIPGPDFPGGGVIVGLDGVADAYATGRGSFRVRARTRTEHVTARRRGIVVTELPPNVGPERVIEKIKDAVTAKRLTGIADVIDLSDGEQGLHLVIELKSGVSPEAILEDLYRATPLEDTVSINAVALVDGEPRTLGLIELIRVFLDHRLEVVLRRSAHRRDRAEERLHLIEGLLVAIVDIDEVIAVIRSSDDAAEARTRLMTVFELSEAQASYILDMPLRRLTKFSRIELETEADGLRNTIEHLRSVVEDDTLLRAEVDRDLEAVAQAHGSPRRTLLLEGSITPISRADQADISDEPCVVLLSSTGLVARIAEIAPRPDAARASHDVLVSAVPARTRGCVGVVTSGGRIHRLDVVDLPALPATAGTPSLGAGSPLGALLNLDPSESVVGLVPLDGDAGLLLATAGGLIKRVSDEFPSQKSDWDVIRLEAGDRVVSAQWLPDREAERGSVVLITAGGQLLHFPASAIRPQGRSAGGVVGIKMSEGDEVRCARVVDPAAAIDVVTIAGSASALPGTELGSVKVTALTSYPSKGRGTQGVRCHKFKKGEDVVTRAWCGAGPARACTVSGSPVDLPSHDDRRDGTGSTPQAPIDAIGTSL
ncbi:MAG: DNA topoisomerase 4 subunit A [Actinobacteria bacterium]|nr:DNA topoisomerase 4 subunit A [Actinomycetota bacterium]